MKCKSDSFMAKDHQQAHGRTYEKDRVNSLPESVQQIMRATTNFQNRKQANTRSRNAKDPTSVQSSTNEHDEDQISLPQLVNSKHGSSQSIQGARSNQRKLNLHQQVSNSRERVGQDMNITNTNNSKSNLHSVKYQNHKQHYGRNNMHYY